METFVQGAKEAALTAVGIAVPIALAILVGTIVYAVVATLAGYPEAAARDRAAARHELGIRSGRESYRNWR